MSTEIRLQVGNRVTQGDILSGVEFIEYAVHRAGQLEISKIEFPNVVVLTQDCDLEQDHRVRSPRQPSTSEDKLLFSALVAPLYNAEHVYKGEHLSELDMKMSSINKAKSPGTSLRQNTNPRYHFLDFGQAAPLVASVVDFKHYFSANIKYLGALKKKNFVCRLAPLFREDLSQRFAAFLSRIGLPVSRKTQNAP